MINKKLKWNDVNWLSADTVIENNTKILIEERAHLGWQPSSNDLWDGTYLVKGLCQHRTRKTATQKPFRYGNTDTAEQNNRD